MGWLPSWPDIVSRQLNRNSEGYAPVNPAYGNYASGIAGQLGTWSKPAMNVGMMNLLRILQSQGKTDPQAMNQQLSNINMDTSGQQTQIGEQAAMGGLGGSGLAKALQAAVGQGGAGMKADLRANEAQQAETRKRQDLQMLIDFFINPALGYGGLGEQGREADQRTRMQREAAMYALMGEIAKSIGNATSGIGGGM